MNSTQAERSRRYRRRQKIKKYGIELADVNLSGKHSNHAKGPRSHNWNPSERLPLSNGYIAVRVPIDHPHAWGAKRLKYFRYAYEHTVVMMQMLGRSLNPDELVHHKNGNKHDNRPENLELLTRSNHAVEHSSVEGIRDEKGRFVANRPRAVAGVD